jgi:hypothetical protein
MREMVLFTAFLFSGFLLQAQNDSSVSPVQNDSTNHLIPADNSSQSQQGDLAFKGHDPRKDANLNPYINKNINPDSNQSINPSMNWNMNPIKENSVNPTKNTAINPMINLQLNPQSNDVLNPVIMKSLRPSTETWKGLFLFSDSNQLFGYISVATQNVMISFDNNGTWNGYYVKAGPYMYNYFTLFGVWTGMFLCYDNQSGYNLFDRNGKWTHIHVK